MAGYAINTSATLQCPHGGIVTIASSNMRSKAASASIATQSDTTTVAGCAFTLPGPKPSPCVRVQWIVADTRVKAGQVPSLSQSAVGICFSADSIS